VTGAPIVLDRQRMGRKSGSELIVRLAAKPALIIVDAVAGDEIIKHADSVAPRGQAKQVGRRGRRCDQPFMKLAQCPIREGPRRATLAPIGLVQRDHFLEGGASIRDRQRRRQRDRTALFIAAQASPDLCPKRRRRGRSVATKVNLKGRLTLKKALLKAMTPRRARAGGGERRADIPEDEL